ncbi:uncharacterized protein LOC133495940 isoform X2 [Syngnathoides biaculeatus]|uniref:uncharacterized protein LOC133495940 isoform X2 n=1 Tax=Syngnathoides biaculeatus TaxID=300417 RepID=UPI002ADE904B|nr:uncharacterized protein LOC133495940 isoform X2 [Syngnathoides biaculeatus]
MAAVWCLVVLVYAVFMGKGLCFAGGAKQGVSDAVLNKGLPDLFNWCYQWSELEPITIWCGHSSPAIKSHLAFVFQVVLNRGCLMCLKKVCKPHWQAKCLETKQATMRVMTQSYNASGKGQLNDQQSYNESGKGQHEDFFLQVQERVNQNNTMSHNQQSVGVAGQDVEGPKESCSL